MTPAILLFSGYSDSGKTEYIAKLTQELMKKGIKTGYIKHHHGKIRSDGHLKDTWKMIDLGIEKTALIAEDLNVVEMRKTELDSVKEIKRIVRSYFSDCQIVFVEGFKELSAFPKIYVLKDGTDRIRFRESLGRREVIACVSDNEADLPCPCFSNSDVRNMMHYLLEYFNLIPENG